MKMKTINRVVNCVIFSSMAIAISCEILAFIIWIMMG